MERNETDLMSLFGSSDFELNMDLDQEDIDLLQDQDDSEETSEEINEEEADDTNELDEGEGSEEVDEDEDTSEEGTDEDETSPNIYSSFASVLTEQGLLPSLDLQEGINTVDDLTAALKSEISNQSKAYIISKIGEEGYDALEKGVSLSQYQDHVSSTDTLENITEESLTSDLELSKRIILQDYVNQGIDETRALRILKKSVDLGDESVIEDALESLVSLKAFQAKHLETVKEANSTRMQQEAQDQEKIDNDLKSAIYTSKELIKGVPVNKTMQDRVYKSITSVVGQSPSGIAENGLMRDRRENPIDFDTKLYYLYEVTNGFKDFSKIMAKTESKVLSNFEKSLRQTKFEDTGKPGFLTDPESYGNMGSELVL